MALLHPTPIDISMIHIHVDREKKWMIVDSSDLRHPRLERLYDDAADIGLALFNPTTLGTVRWYLAEEEVDSEGELQVQIFKPCSESVIKYPAVEGYELHVLND